MDEYRILVESMEVISAQEQLRAFEASSISNMTDRSRSKVINEHKKVAERFKKKKIFTTDQLFKLLQG